MIEEDLARFTAGISFRDIDKNTLHILKRNIIDSYAGICASLQDEELLEKFRSLAAMDPREEAMGIWGIGTKGPVDEALFMNTILARRSDLLGTYFSPHDMGGNHPADNTALVLSLADWLNKDGKSLLTYTYAAYILSCAFSDYYNPEQNGYDHDAMALLYTSLITGYILEAGYDDLVRAQQIAGVFGLDIDQTAKGEVTDWKHCTYASCALRALHIVRMAKAGFPGARDIYEGEAGLNRFIPHYHTMLETLPDLGSIIIKRWPALVFCQTPIDVALNIAGAIGNPDDIVHVEVQTFALAMANGATDSSYNPNTRAGRTHSIPYCVAAALLKNTVEYSFFDDDFPAKEPGIAALIRKVRVVENTGMTAKYPDCAPCRITVTLRDGSVITRSRDYPKGDPHDPLTDQELEEKARKNFCLIMDESTADEIIRRIWNLENEETIAWLVAPLQQNRMV